GPDGTHALAARLAGQGKRVSAVDTAAAGLARAGRPHTALVIADPGLVGGSSLAALAATSADLLIVAPGRRALGVLAPGVTLAARAPVASHPPQCSWPGARLAGPADMGGPLLHRARPGGGRCY